MFHQSYIQALILGNLITLVYTKKCKQIRILKKFEFEREVGIHHCYKSKETSILKREMNCPQVQYLELSWIIYKV